MLRLSFAKPWHSVPTVLILIATMIGTGACVSSVKLWRHNTGPPSGGSGSSLRAIGLESRFSWSDAIPSTPGSSTLPDSVMRRGSSSQTILGQSSRDGVRTGS